MSRLMFWAAAAKKNCSRTKTRTEVRVRGAGDRWVQVDAASRLLRYFHFCVSDSRVGIFSHTQTSRKGVSPQQSIMANCHLDILLLQI